MLTRPSGRCVHSRGSNPACGVYTTSLASGKFVPSFEAPCIFHVAYFLRIKDRLLFATSTLAHPGHSGHWCASTRRRGQTTNHRALNEQSASILCDLCIWVATWPNFPNVDGRCPGITDTWLRLVGVSYEKLSLGKRNRC